MNRLSIRLEKFKKKGEYLWNFRCPICGDSQKNKNKARGFVFRVKGDLLYKRHNCQYSVPLPKLIEVIDSALYQQYRLEKFKETRKPRNDMRKVNKIVSKSPVFEIDVTSTLTPITELNTEHPAKEYLLQRK